MSGYEAVLQEAEQSGWLQALARVLDAEELDLATHPERAAFIQVLRAREGSRVLEISPGWGGVTVELARASFHVWALEQNPERARFIELRARQEGLSHLIETGPEGTRGKFDVIVTHEPASSVSRSLGELRERLAPGGLIYLGGPNRRPWQSSARGLTHDEYARIFAGAGLQIQTAYASPRGFRNPSELVPMQGQAIRYYTRMRLEPQGRNMKGILRDLAKRACASPWCWKRFGHDFVFFLEAADA